MEIIATGCNNMGSNCIIVIPGECYEWELSDVYETSVSWEYQGIQMGQFIFPPKQPACNNSLNLNNHKFEICIPQSEVIQPWDNGNSFVEHSHGGGNQNDNDNENKNGNNKTQGGDGGNMINNDCRLLLNVIGDSNMIDDNAFIIRKENDDIVLETEIIGFIPTLCLDNYLSQDACFYFTLFDYSQNGICCEFSKLYIHT